MKPVVSALDSAPIRIHAVTQQKVVAPPAVAVVLVAIAPKAFHYFERSIGQSVAEPLKNAIAIALSGRPSSNLDCQTLTHDPLAGDPSAWATLRGSAPEFVTGINDFPAGSTALQNRAGAESEVFTCDLIHINREERYQLELSVRQYIGTRGISYLALAWYDERSRLLESYLPSPEGAGQPVGWVNGTFSYFGLRGETAPRVWTTYRVSFGPNEMAEIPRNAKFIRVGALLNYNAISDTTIQLTNVRLWKKLQTDLIADGVFASDEHLFVISPASWMRWTYVSHAAQASHHWFPQEVATGLAGDAELAAAALTVGCTTVSADNLIFQLKEPKKSPSVSKP